MTTDFGLLISHTMTGQTFSLHIIYFDSLHSVDSVGLFIEMYPKAKNLHCFSTSVLPWW